VLWAAAAAAVLVPARLLEPRYFIIPYVLWRMHAAQPGARSATAAAAAAWLCHAAVLALFVLRPFRWPDGSLARFMW
jgi:alpha-1,2-glucosyltransferase